MLLIATPLNLTTPLELIYLLLTNLCGCLSLQIQQFWWNLSLSLPLSLYPSLSISLFYTYLSRWYLSKLRTLFWSLLLSLSFSLQFTNFTISIPDLQNVYIGYRNCTIVNVRILFKILRKTGK